MTFDEALSELGVPRGSAAPAVRRAYLRLLKTRKPEVDPEGYYRLLEAYEICRSLSSLRDGPPPSSASLSGAFMALEHLDPIDRPDVPAPEIAPPPDSLHALAPGMPAAIAGAMRGSAAAAPAPTPSDYRWIYVPIALTVLWIVFQLATSRN